MNKNIIDIKKVIKKVDLSAVTIWRMERRGEFPSRIKIGHRRVGWVESELDEWLTDRPRVHKRINTPP